MDHASFGRQQHIRPNIGRKLHYTSLVVMVASLLHGLLAGSGAGGGARRSQGTM